MTSTAGDLFEAIEASDVEGVRRILASRPELAASRDADGVSALLRARYRLDRALVEAVRAELPALDVFEAAALGDLDRLATLLADDPALASARAGDGFTPLHLAAYFGTPAAARLLLDRGADPDARGTGWMTGTPVHSAASAGHADSVALLLAAGADPDARQSGGLTALHAAAHRGDLATVSALLDAGADARVTAEDGRDALAFAEEGGDTATIGRIRAALA
jgi:adenosylhomocysteine nucleosidase